MSVRCFAHSYRCACCVLIHVFATSTSPCCRTLLPLKSALEQGAAQLRCVADDVRMIGASAGETVDRLAVAFANTVQFAEDVAHAVTSLKYCE